MPGDKGDHETKGTYYNYRPELLHHYPEGHALHDPRSNEPPDEELVQSILDYGVQRIMKVRREAEGSGLKPGIYITDGRRRHRAAEEARRRQKANGLVQTVLCRCEHEKLDPMAGMVVGNILQKSWSDLQKGELCARMLAHGQSYATMARMFATSAQTVRNWVDLTKAPSEVKEAAANGMISSGMARDLATAAPSVVQEVLDQARKNPAAVRGEQARQVVKAKKRSNGHTASDEDAPVRLTVRQMTQLVGELAPGQLDEPDAMCDVAIGVLEFLLGTDPTAKRLNTYSDCVDLVKLLRRARRKFLAREAS